MSLQIAAQHMASRGRGPDTQLVHMAPQEVAGLQALAKAHGGSLTINPDTGLPEAGFLSSILPTVIGAGLSIASGGTLTPLMSAMMVGGGYGLATGSLSKGLTAGLGAYGGAGLGSALAGAGATQGLMAEGAAAQAAMGEAANAKDILLARGADTAAASPGMFGNAAANMKNAQAGLAGLTSEAGRGAFMGQIGGGKGLMQAGMMAASPMLAAPVTQQPEIKTDADMGQRYRFSPGAIRPTPTPDAGGREQKYFAPTYTAIGDEEAKNIYGFAAGGPVENMSNMNTLGANTGYPQSDIAPRAYATPYQQPSPQNVVTGAQDAGVDPYTGQQQFADGGVTELLSSAAGPLGKLLGMQRDGDRIDYTYDPKTQTYSTKEGQGATTIKPPSMGGGSGGDSTPGAPSGYRDPYSLTNGLIPGLIGLQAEAPVSYAGTDLANQIAQQQMQDAAYSMGNPATMGYSPGEIASMQAQDAAYSMGPPSGGESPASGGFSDVGGLGAAAAADAAAGGYLAKGGLTALAQGGAAQYNLGGYSDGGRLLRGPGDGVSDDIPAVIGDKQPARLADGEFVVPARIVSELGNGSTEAGARKLYAMMDRVQKARKKSIGKDKVAADSKAHRLLPA